MVTLKYTLQCFRNDDKFFIILYIHEKINKNLHKKNSLNIIFHF